MTTEQVELAVLEAIATLRGKGYSDAEIEKRLTKAIEESFGVKVPTAPEPTTASGRAVKKAIAERRWRG